MKIWIMSIVILLSTVQFATQAQTPMMQVQDSTLATTASVRTAWNNVFIEIGGSGLYGSVNYERFLNNWFAIRIGISPLFIGTTIPPVLASGSIFLGENEHKFELGMGIWAKANLSGIIGYRYQPFSTGWMFRCAFTPIHSPALFSAGDFTIPYWGGLSIGYSF